MNRVTLSALAAAVLAFATLASGQQPLLTVAERSDYKATAKNADVVEYCEALARQSPLVRVLTLGTTHEGRKQPLVVLADPPVNSPEEARKSGKLVVLLIGNIHAGEVDGKEALLMVMRDLALARDRPLLKDLVLLFVPNFNADGGDKMAKTNRTHQNGPPEVGTRANAQNFDLNRDYVKLESPEVRSLVRCFNEWDPALFIDCHTTNGSYHQNAITYDGPRHPSCDPKLVEHVRDAMLPDLGERFRKKSGFLANFYGNFAQGNTVWDTYPAEPRYGTQYVGLRHRLGILVESYVYAPYKDRVLASRDFVLASLEQAAGQRKQIQDLLKNAEANAPKRVLSLRHKLMPMERKVTIVAIEGGKTAPPGTTKEVMVSYLGKAESTLDVARPHAYVIPASFSKAVETLQRHGIQCHEVTAAAKVEGEVYKVTRITAAPKAFQDHKLVKVEVTLRKEARQLQLGERVVLTNQPLGTLAAFLLEPQAEDGLTTWNAFDSGLKEQADFPVWRLPATVEIRLQPLAAPKTPS